VEAAVSPAIAPNRMNGSTTHDSGFTSQFPYRFAFRGSSAGFTYLI